MFCTKHTLFCLKLFFWLYFFSELTVFYKDILSTFCILVIYLKVTAICCKFNLTKIVGIDAFSHEIISVYIF